MDMNSDLFFDRILLPWNEGDFRFLDEQVQPDFQFYSPDFVEVQNYEMFQEWVRAVRQAYPDFHAEITDKMVCADKLAIQWVYTGTNTGMLMNDIPPTGHFVELSGATIFHMVGDKIKTVWWFYNQYELFQKLGLVPDVVGGVPA